MTMAQPKNRHNDPGDPTGKIVSLRGNRVLRKPCRECGTEFDVDLGPASIPDSPIDMLVMSMARQLVCDACAARFVSREQASRRREEAERLIQRKDVLPGFGKHTLDRSMAALEMYNRPAWAEGRDWISSGMGRSVIIHGDGDSGKTHLARTLVIEAWRKGKSILEVTGWGLFDGSMLYRSEEIAGKVTRMRRVSVLYIQGIDRGEPKGKHLGLLLEIMEERHARGLVTIMESQLEPVNIAEKWTTNTGDPGIGGDIFSRLHPVVKLSMQRPRENGEEVGMRKLEGTLRQQVRG